MKKFNKKISSIFQNLSFSQRLCFSANENQNLNFTKEKEEKIHEKIVSEYFNDINENSTDFKQEFGFVDSIKDAHHQYKRNERKINIYFTIFWAALCTGG